MNRGVIFHMPPSTREPSIRTIPALWGLDVAFAAFCWAMCGVENMQITMVSEGPVLLLVASVWVYTILSRTHAAIRRRSGWYHDYYENHAAPMLLLALAAAAAGIWMLCFYVGKHVLPYVCIPVFFLLLSAIPARKAAVFKGFCKSIAFGSACMVPAFSMSFELTPLNMFFCAPCWYTGILFFLFQQERTRWEETGTPHSHSRLLLCGLFCLLIVCALSAGRSSYFEHSMGITIAMGAACLMLLAKIRSNLDAQGIFCLCWPVMTLPALLAILLFSPTEQGTDAHYGTNSSALGLASPQNACIILPLTLNQQHIYERQSHILRHHAARW